MSIKLSVHGNTVLEGRDPRRVQKTPQARKIGYFRDFLGISLFLGISRVEAPPWGGGVVSDLMIIDKITGFLVIISPMS